MGRIVVFLLVVVTACAGLGKRTAMDVRCNFNPERDSLKNFQKGFCGPDSYRIKSFGVPAKIEIDKKRRRESAVYAATLSARHFMFLFLEGYCIEQSMQGFPKGYAERKKAWQKEIRELVKNGKSVYTTCDEKDNCTILYELRVKGLRKKIDACYR